MNKILAICILLLFGMSIVGCSQPRQPATQEVTFEQLFSNLKQYDGRYVTLEGFYFDGFEIQVITENLEDSGYAEGHLIPNGRMIWVEGGIPKEVYDKLYQQQMMGPEERYGKVRVTGKFEYGGTYGHVGDYSSQIVPSEVTLLMLSQPAKQ